LVTNRIAVRRRPPATPPASPSSSPPSVLADGLDDLEARLDRDDVRGGMMAFAAIGGGVVPLADRPSTMPLDADGNDDAAPSDDSDIRTMQ
jgi:hypothetical protein